jgi:hypothetical protein
MAQTGFTPIQLFRTSTAAAVPTSGNLVDGELAINLTDEKLYFKNAAGTVKLLAANITPVANGGTGATTAGNARTNLGSTTLGSNLFTITNPGAVTFPRFNADNTVSSLNAADFRTAIGAGTGGGDVTLAGVQTLTNKTIAFADNTLTNVVSTNTAQTITGTKTFSGTSSTLAEVLTNAAEVATVSATAATGTIAYDITTQSVLYYTSNASANWTVNFRASSGTSLNTALATGQSVTVAFLVTQGATAYYNSAVQVDGTTSGVTTRWLGGAPTAGNASGIDSYRFLILKTGSATFTVLASVTQFKA